MQSCVKVKVNDIKKSASLNVEDSTNQQCYDSAGLLIHSDLEIDDEDNGRIMGGEEVTDELGGYNDRDEEESGCV
jgi:hypothetical protein